ncbi:MAG: CoA-binding protein [Actinomycetota bacterium]|nr:CoA-binding protein [Actinomycetota bacterium]
MTAQPAREAVPYAPSDRELRALLGNARTVAVVGLSSDPRRASYRIAAYLQSKGYRVVPVNPNEREVLGEKSYPSLREVPEAVDVVDVFRRPEYTPDVARDAVAAGAKVLWLQSGIINDEARRIAEDAGLDVVMGVCIHDVAVRLEEEGAGR